MMCDLTAQVERWPEFEGYGIVPGIANAAFETRTDGMIGSHVRVQNRDGSSHTEEFIDWVPGKRVLIRMSGFSKPLGYLADHFLEEWRFEPVDGGSHVWRKFS